MHESGERDTGTTGTRPTHGGLYSDPAAAVRGIRRFPDSRYEGVGVSQRAYR
jgi:hypothetical protein